MTIGVQVVDAAGSGLSTMVPLDTCYVEADANAVLQECKKQFDSIRSYMSLPFSSIDVVDTKRVLDKIALTHMVG